MPSRTVADLEPMERRVNTAGSPKDLFGSGADRDRIRRSYLLWSQEVAEDFYADPDLKRRAREAFMRLKDLHDEALRRLADGTYEVTAKSVPASAGAATFASKRGSYTITHALKRGDVANLYRASFTPKDGLSVFEVLLKVARSAKDNDLLKAEAASLLKLQGMPDANQHLRFISDFVETLQITDKGPARQASVFNYYPAFFSMEEIKAQYPDGIDPRDSAWMFRRILAGLSFVHAGGIVHGGLVPSNILLQTVEHGATIVGWCSSVSQGKDSRVKIVSTPYQDLYAPEITATKDRVSPATDIFMAVKSVLWLTTSMVDSRLLGFFNTCLVRNPDRRPQSAARLLEEFTELLVRLYGPRKFRVFDMPRKTAAASR
jgi:serine/threonine protein kinase